ncbi:MAG: chitobiase/beta-hexosaminidase C-terminal domain-containing protein [Muribaculaceae bacterium]|nr:chitobiase/beta-hexosaminidase C-terminal domain-containing protein [Muribaculaceae bacterium]
MKKLFAALLLVSAMGLSAQAEEITVTFSDLGLDSGSLNNYEINDNIYFTSDGTFNTSNEDFRLTSGKTFTVNLVDATLTGVQITCDSGYEFGALSIVKADEQTSEYNYNPFSWSGEATQNWSVNAYPSSYNVRMRSITLTYTPKAVAEDLTATILCQDMGVADQTSLPATGFNINEYLNVNFVQGTHTAVPTYRASVSGFYIFNGQQIEVTAKDGAKLLKIEIATTTNTFGYAGSVTADGVTQTYEEDYTWVPCVWKGLAEQSVVFTNGGRTGNTQVTGLTITYQTPIEGEITVSRPVITPSDTDNTVTITCETADATIYYTLDGTEPSNENGITYNGEFTLENPCTVKAIAYYETVASSVASLDVPLNIVYSLGQFFVNAELLFSFDPLADDTKAVKIDCNITAITSLNSETNCYLFVTDNQGNYGIITKRYETDQEGFDVENGTTWSYLIASYKQFYSWGDGYFYINAEEYGSESKGTAVEPNLITSADVEDTTPYEYVQLNNVTVELDGNYGDLIYTDEDGEEVYGYKRFDMVEVPVSETDEDRYDVTGVMVYHPEDDFYELWPVSFAEANSSAISSIQEKEGNAEYFDLNGFRVNKPAKGGFYIMRKDGKASKFLLPNK